MAKSSKPIVSSALKPDDVDLSDTLDIAFQHPYNEPESSTKVVCVFPAQYSCTGHVTGKPYRWNGAGSVVDVDNKDVAEILAKRQGNITCCGSDGQGNVMFTLI